jgi:hypothetical protein
LAKLEYYSILVLIQKKKVLFDSCRGNTLHESKIYPIRVGILNDHALKGFLVKENKERLAMPRSTFFAKPSKERKRLSIHDVTTMHNNSVTLPVDQNWIYQLDEGVQQTAPPALPHMTI